MKSHTSRAGAVCALACAAVALGVFFSSETSATAPKLDLLSIVEGDYVEARTCDVWTGPCFSNSEINLTGDHGVMAWSVRKGVWSGARLDGLRVAASMDAEGTLGSTIEGKVRTVVYIDQRASAKQAKALLSMVKKLAPRYTKDVVKVERREIAFHRRGENVRVEVGREAETRLQTIMELQTMPLNSHCDIICGNEEKAYSSMATTKKSECAKTVVHSYRGTGLGVQWSDPGARSAMVGRFEL